MSVRFRYGVKFNLTEYVLGMIILVCFVICFFYPNRTHMILNWLGILIFIFNVYSWKNHTDDKWFSAYTVFMAFFTVFNYGIPIMWAFGIHKAHEIGTFGSMFTESEVIQGQLYTCAAMLFFHFGALFSTRFESVTENDYAQEHDTDRVRRAMRIVCSMTLTVSAPVAIIQRVRDVIIARAYGYHALYYGAHSTQSGYSQIIIFLFLPSIIGMLIGCGYSKKVRFVCWGIFGIYATLGLLSGDRGSWLYGLIILIWLHTYYRKTTFKKYVTLGLIGFVGITILSVVTSVRNSGLQFTFSGIIDAFSSDNNAIVSAFFEMGFSMEIVMYLLRAGNGIFPYANTYLTAILGIASSKFLNLIGLKQVLVADWFSQEYLGITWGTGFSMVGEAYLNGGYVGGIVYMVILGFVYGIIFKKASAAKAKNPLKLFVSVASMQALIGLSRGACYLTLKELFYGVFLVWVLIKIVSRVFGG